MVGSTYAVLHEKPAGYDALEPDSERGSERGSESGSERGCESGSESGSERCSESGSESGSEQKQAVARNTFLCTFLLLLVWLGCLFTVSGFSWSKLSSTIQERAQESTSPCAAQALKFQLLCLAVGMLPLPTLLICWFCGEVAIPRLASGSLEGHDGEALLAPCRSDSRSLSFERRRA